MVPAIVAGPIRTQVTTATATNCSGPTHRYCRKGTDSEKRERSLESMLMRWPVSLLPPSSGPPGGGPAGSPTGGGGSTESPLELLGSRRAFGYGKE